MGSGAVGRGSWRCGLGKDEAPPFLLERPEKKKLHLIAVWEAENLLVTNCVLVSVLARVDRCRGAPAPVKHGLPLHFVAKVLLLVP